MDDESMLIVLCILLGAGGGFLGYKFYKVGIYIQAIFYSGIIMFAFSLIVLKSFPLAILLAIVGNVLAIFLVKKYGDIYIIITVAIAAAFIYLKPGACMIMGSSEGAKGVLITLFALVVAGFGAYYQIKKLNVLNKSSNMSTIATGQLSDTGDSFENIKYETVVSENGPFYVEGSPVVIKKYSISKNKDESAFFDMDIQNIDDKSIIALYYKLECYTVLGERTVDTDENILLDLKFNRNQTMSLPKKLLLHDKSIRECKIFITHVVFEDRSKLDFNEEFKRIELETIPYCTRDVQKSFKKYINLEKSRANYQYKPVLEEYYWVCGCGQLNDKDECIACGLTRQNAELLLNREWLEENHRKTVEEAERERERKKQEFINKSTETINTVNDKVKSTFTGIKGATDELISKNKATKPQDDSQNMCYCASCGKKISSKSKFCPYCGSKQINE